VEGPVVKRRVVTRFVVGGALLSLLAAQLLLSAGAVSAAGPETFTAQLSGAQEAPSVTGNGTGSATFTVSADEQSIAYSVSYSGLSGAVVAAHIHAGSVGVLGPIILPLAVAASPMAGTLTAADLKVAGGVSTFALPEDLLLAECRALQALARQLTRDRHAAEDAVQAFRSLADEKGVTLETGSVDAPARIEADPVRLAEVLGNLVGNAVRHTPRGGRVAVLVSGGGGGAVFAVEDTGPGIPLDQLPFVFDRFVTSVDKGGTGLGLAISKRLVEAHDGRIEATATQAGGTRIRFVIPARPLI
jgi:hypothetical protein